MNESEVLRWVTRQWQRLNGKDEISGYFRSKVGSGWALRNLQKCTHTVLEGENLNPLASAQSESLLRHCRK